MGLLAVDYCPEAGKGGKQRRKLFGGNRLKLDHKRDCRRCELWSQGPVARRNQRNGNTLAKSPPTPAGVTPGLLRET